VAFDRGARVRLSEKYALALMRRQKNRINWVARRGVVIRCSKKGEVYIVWDGCRSADAVPLRAVDTNMEE
jgi:hypothetical protein